MSIGHMQAYVYKGYHSMGFIIHFPQLPHILSKTRGFLSIFSSSIKAFDIAYYVMSPLYLPIPSIIIYHTVDHLWQACFTTMPVFCMKLFFRISTLESSRFLKISNSYYKCLIYLHLLFENVWEHLSFSFHTSLYEICVLYWFFIKKTRKSYVFYAFCIKTWKYSFFENSVWRIYIYISKKDILLKNVTPRLTFVDLVKLSKVPLMDIVIAQKEASASWRGMG